MKPTLEEYNKAKSNKAFAQNALRHCRERMNELIDELAAERASEISYNNMIIQANDILLAYEVYENIEKGKKK